MAQLYYREYGEPEAGKPTLVFLHGLFGSSANWGGIVRQLQNKWHILVPDLRNHGQSFHSEHVSYPMMAEDVVALVNDKGLHQIFVIGHSMGGKVAMTMAETIPDLVRGLVVVDIAPMGYKHDFSVLFTAMLSLDLASLSNRSEAQRALTQKINDEAIAAYLLQNLVRDGDQWRWRMNIQVLQDKISTIAGFPASLSCPATFVSDALFLYGERSDYVQGSALDTVMRYYPQASIQSIDRAGHWVYAEQPEQFLQYIEQFFHHNS